MLESRTRHTIAPGAVGTAAAELVRQMAHAEDRASYLIPARELTRSRSRGERADVRNWPVIAGDGRMVGAVDRLFVEAATGKVRWLGVSLAYHAANDRKPTVQGSVMIPVGEIRRHDDRRALAVDDLTSAAICNAPRLHARPITRAEEDATLAVFGLATSRDVRRDEYYDREEFDERRLFVAVS